MHIQIKLMASLRRKLPADAKGGMVELQLPASATLAEALAALDIADSQVHLVMRNGEQETDLQRPLADGDEVVVFPPVAGG